jgi:hypothetical protein
MDENADFIAKLREIEEQAHSLGAALGASLERTRAQHIVLLARALRGHLELGRVHIVRTEPHAGAGGPETKPKPRS